MNEQNIHIFCELVLLKSDKVGVTELWGSGRKGNVNNVSNGSGVGDKQLSMVSCKFFFLLLVCNSL